MRYLYLIKTDKEIQAPPPPRLIEEMGKLITRRTAEGALLDTAGLTPVAQAHCITLKQGKLTMFDGPFAESKEVVGGYAMFKFDTRAEAIDAAREFMELHRLHAPDWEFTCEMREINDGATPQQPC